VLKEEKVGVRPRAGGMKNKFNLKVNMHTKNEIKPEAAKSSVLIDLEAIRKDLFSDRDSVSDVGGLHVKAESALDVGDGVGNEIGMGQGADMDILEMRSDNDNDLLQMRSLSPKERGAGKQIGGNYRKG